MSRPIRVASVFILVCAVLAVYLWRNNVAAVPPAKTLTAPNVPTVVKGGNQFAFDLYAKLRGESDSNLFFSPTSISTALAMTYAGARGETATQMANVLHLDPSNEQIHQAEAALLNYWNALGEQGPVKLTVANRLWGQRGYKFLDDYLSLLKDEYGAGLEQVDFAQTETARKTINDWVENATAGEIKDLLPEGVLNSLTRLVLTNAVYFKGTWEVAFEKKATLPDTFHVSTTKQLKDIPTMHRTGRFRFNHTALTDGKQFKLLEMPYKGNQFSMIVLLPEAIDGLAELEKQLSVDNLQQWLDAARETKVMVSFPKFKVTGTIQLADALSALGMTDAFNTSNADFSGMDGSKDLHISAVIHKAFVDVNEEGTEAAAATGVVMELAAAPVQEQPTFHADHPFVLFIRDNTTGAILFMGRVVDPQQ